MTNNSTLTNQVADFCITEKEWDNYRKLLEKLNFDMDKLLHDTESLSQLKDKVIKLEPLMETKIDKEEFNRWITDNNIKQILSGIVKKFADRNEMLKALKKLEARIIGLEELMNENEGDNVESVLLAKKPLGGWSCASCQRDIINLEGMRTQYYPWAKFPQRYSTERIARLGQGFSKVLAGIKPDLRNHSQRLVVQKRYEEEPKTEEPHNERSDAEQEAKSLSITNVFPDISPSKVWYYLTHIGWSIVSFIINIDFTFNMRIRE